MLDLYKINASWLSHIILPWNILKNRVMLYLSWQMVWLVSFYNRGQLIRGLFTFFHFFLPFFWSNRKSPINNVLKTHLKISPPLHTLFKAVKCTRYSRHFGLLLTPNIVQGGGEVSFSHVWTKKVVTVPYVLARIVVWKKTFTSLHSTYNIDYILINLTGITEEL